MTDIEAEESRAEPPARPILRVVADASVDGARPTASTGPAVIAADVVAGFLDALDSAERRARDLAFRVEQLRAELRQESSPTERARSLSMAGVLGSAVVVW